MKLKLFLHEKSEHFQPVILQKIVGKALNL